jgi:hypothetical protein
MALAHLHAVMGRSGVFTVPAGWIERCLAAWPEAGIIRFVRRHVGGLPMPQRVRMFGWMVAVAVLTESVFARAGGVGALPFSLGAKLTCLALAGLFMIGGGSVAAAWRDHQRWNTNS